MVVRILGGTKTQSEVTHQVDMPFPTLQRIVDAYIRRWRDHARQEQRWFAIQGSLDAAIENAAMARRPNGKRLSHQRRIPAAVLRAWTDCLEARARKLGNATTFDELHELIAREAQELHGIGRLTVYDTANRIGAFLGLEPDRIYLHAGTREGAHALGIRKREWLKPSDLPRAFRRLSAGEIEDCLCIFKRQIAAIAERRPVDLSERSRSC